MCGGAQSGACTRLLLVWAARQWFYFGYDAQVETYLATSATVIPVLLVAGMLSPRMLSWDSRTEKGARRAKWMIIGALFSALFTLLAIPVVPDEDLVWWLQIIFQLIPVPGLGLAAGVVISVAWLALDEYPHPDRLESEANELEYRLALVRRKQKQARPAANSDSD